MGCLSVGVLGVVVEDFGASSGYVCHTMRPSLCDAMIVGSGADRFDAEEGVDKT